MSLTPDLVHQIRTAGLTDTWWAQRLRKSSRAIRHARQGLTYRHILTPPDTAPRDGTGRRTYGGPVRAKPARRRWSYFRDS